MERLRPWLASFGLALPASLLLMGFSLHVSHGYQRLTDATPGLDVLQLLCSVGAVGCVVLDGWLCHGGIVPAHRSCQRSARVRTLPLLLARFRGESLSRFCLFLFLLPAIWGVVRGLRPAQIRLGAACALAIATTLLSLPSWTQPGAWIANWALSWPAWYLVAMARRPMNKLS